MPRSRLVRSLILFAVVVATLGVLAFVFFDAIGRVLVPILTPDWQPELTGPADGPRFSEADASLKRGSVRLEKLSEGWTQVTALVFPPGRSDTAVVLQRTGDALHWTQEGDARGPLLHVDVASVTEQGLLGIAFHPGYAENGRVFVNTVEGGAAGDESLVTEWRFDPPLPLAEAQATPGDVLLRVPQPFQNHNAGQLAFGPDGMLYVGYGDGGLADDPHHNGQNPETFLGSLLRIDVDHKEPGRAYAVPPDNPFLGRDGFAPETWAYGLRNPWRYSFDGRGRLWVADVGQDAVEEVNIVERGDNLGWDLREGFDCTSRDADCEAEGLKGPVWVYRHELGASITGGFVYEGDAVPALRGHYLCADFLSGRLFAVPDPASGDPMQAVSLGQWPLLPSTFGRDAAGEIYVADFAGGILYGLRGGDSPETPSASPEASDETQPEAPAADGAPMPTGAAAAGEAVYPRSPAGPLGSAAMASQTQWSDRIRNQILHGDVWPAAAGGTHLDAVEGLFDRSSHGRRVSIAVALAPLLSDQDLVVRTGAVLLLERVGEILGAHRLSRLLDATLGDLEGVAPEARYIEFVGPDLAAPLRRLVAKIEVAEAP